MHREDGRGAGRVEGASLKTMAGAPHTSTGPGSRFTRRRHRLRACGEPAAVHRRLRWPWRFVSKITVSPLVSSGKIVDLLFTAGVTVISLVTVIYSLLFVVVQWVSGAFSMHYAHNYVGREIHRVSAQEPLPVGGISSASSSSPPASPIRRGEGAPGRAQLYVDGQLIANGDFPVTTPIAFNPGGLTCGANPGSAIIPDYHARAPFPFTGVLRTVTIDLSGDLITDTESEMRMAMARQ